MGNRPEKWTDEVLGQVGAERARQRAKWGDQRLPDGTDPGLTWLLNILDEAARMVPGDMSDIGASAIELRELATHRTDRRLDDKTATWVDIILEELAEAFAETDQAKLRTEVVQAAAVLVQWVENIDKRAFEASHPVVCHDCGGLGGDYDTPAECLTCEGSGRVTEEDAAALGWAETATA